MANSDVHARMTGASRVQSTAVDDGLWPELERVMLRRTRRAVLGQLELPMNPLSAPEEWIPAPVNADFITTTATS